MVNCPQSKEYKIHVAVRLRPLLDSELNDEELVYKVDDRSLVISKGKSKSTLSFDRLFGKADSQEIVFDHLTDSILSVLDGYNSTIFAYGQTGTGKTYTMMGGVEFDELDENIDVYLENPPPSTLPVNYNKFNNLKGIIPRSIDLLFRAIQDSPIEYDVHCSYLEIYNEKLFDLLNFDNRETNLEIREKHKRIYVPNIQTVRIIDLREIYEMLRDGTYNRAIGITDMNERSSRSHTIFQIIVESKPDLGAKRISKLNLVDLAGSEKWNTYGKTKMSDEKILELTSINKSLSTLGKCIFQLRKGNAHIPYRESKLTRLLQDSLGGNTKTMFIATLSPSAIAFEETLSTLKFAVRAMKVVVTASVNEFISDDLLIRRLKDENLKLKDIVKSKNSKLLNLENENQVLKEQLDVFLPFMKHMNSSKNVESNSENSENSNNLKVLNGFEIKKVLGVVLMQKKEIEKKMLNDIMKLKKKLKEKKKNFNICKNYIKKMKDELDYFKSKLKLKMKTNIENSPLLKDSGTLKNINQIIGNTSKSKAEEEEDGKELFELEEDFNENQENEIIFREVKKRSILGLSNSVNRFKIDINSLLKEHLKEIVLEPFLETQKFNSSRKSSNPSEQQQNNQISNSSVENIEEELEMLIEGCCDALNESLIQSQKKYLEIFYGLVKDRNRKIGIRKNNKISQTEYSGDGVLFNSEESKKKIEKLISRSINSNLLFLTHKGEKIVTKKKVISNFDDYQDITDMNSSSLTNENDETINNKSKSKVYLSNLSNLTNTESDEILKCIMGLDIYSLYVEKKEMIRDTQSKILVATSVLRRSIKRIISKFTEKKSLLFLNINSRKKNNSKKNENDSIEHEIIVIEEKLKYLKILLKEFQSKSFLRDEKKSDISSAEEEKIREVLNLE